MTLRFFCRTVLSSTYITLYTRSLADKFVAELSDYIDCIMTDKTDSVMIVPGVFNMFSTDFLVACCGLCQSVASPSKGEKTVDKFFINRPDFVKFDGSTSVTSNIRCKVTIYCIPESITLTIYPLSLEHLIGLQ